MKGIEQKLQSAICMDEWWEKAHYYAVQWPGREKEDLEDKKNVIEFLKSACSSY